jgi:hypothetical protein
MRTTSTARPEPVLLDRSELARNWHLAMRTAAVTSLVLATVAGALYSFADISRPMIVLALAPIALIVGLALPAAAPARR